MEDWMTFVCAHVILHSSVLSCLQYGRNDTLNTAIDRSIIKRQAVDHVS